MKKNERVVPKLRGPFHNRSESLPCSLMVFQLACPKNSEIHPNQNIEKLTSFVPMCH